MTIQKQYDSTEKELLQLFIDLPGLTEAKGHYKAEMKRMKIQNQDVLGCCFVVSKGADQPDLVEKILKKYTEEMVGKGIDGVDYDQATDALIVRDFFSVVAGMDRYLDKNPEKLSSDIVDTLRDKIGRIGVSLALQGRVPTPHTDSMEQELNSTDYKRAMEFLALFCKIPSELCGLYDGVADGMVNKNGSVEVGFTLDDAAKKNAKQEWWHFMQCLDVACAENPNDMCYDADDNLYVFSTVSELYNFVRDYFDSLLPEDSYGSSKLLSFSQSKTLAMKEALASIFDDYIPNMSLMEDGEEYSKPRSVRAADAGFRAFLSNIDGTENFYLNCVEDKEEGIFIFTIGCSEFFPESQPDDKLEIMEEVYSTIILHDCSSEVSVWFHESGDNIDIATGDLRNLLPFFRSVYTEFDMGGPEDVFLRVPVKNGVIDHDVIRKTLNESEKAFTATEDFNEQAPFKDCLEVLPMRVYNSRQGVMLGSGLKSGADASMSIEGIEAAIYQEYEGAKSIRRLSAGHKPHILH